MIFKTTLKDINTTAIAIDKLNTVTATLRSTSIKDYTLYGAAIDRLNVKQLALALSTQNLTDEDLKLIIEKNNLIEKYGAEELIKAGLLSTNSSLLVSEKAVNAEDMQKLLIKKGVNEEEVKEFIQKQLIVTANGEESASTILLNKALMDEAVKRGIISEEKALEILSTYGVVTADIAETASKKALAKAIKELMASKISLSALDVSMIAGVAALAFTIYECNKAIKEVRNTAKELGSTFKSTSSDIDDYKSKIEDLYNTINDNKSSIEDVTNARKSLLSIQDELIDKFGTEESVIKDVTDAINGQTDALDRLSKTKWQELKNEFNNGGFWNDVINFFQGKNNIERMLDEYGEQNIAFRWADYAGDNIKLTDGMVAELENIGINIKVSTDNLQSMRDFDSLTESIEDTKGATLILSGNAEEIYNKILSLQNLINGDDSYGKLYENIERHANSYKELTDKYKDFYNQYILQEKIFAKDSKYANTFKDITDAAEKYNEAFMSGNEEEIKKASDEYASLLSSAMATAIANGDSDVATYFENMYPTLKTIVSGWQFNVAFDANTDDLQGKVQTVLDELKDENGRSLTTEEILGLGEANEQYQALVSIARSYNMSIEEMIKLLKERNLVSAMDYQGLVSLFGQENVDTLSTEDLEIAYTINNIGNMTFEELQAEIQRTKEYAKENPVTFSTHLTNSKDSIDDFQSKLNTLGDTLSSIRSGNFEDSDLTDLLQEFPELADKTDDLESAITKLIKKSLTDLYETLGEEIPDGLKSSFQEITDLALGTAVHLSDAFSSIHDSWDILQDFKDVMDEGFDENVTDSLLQSVRGLSGELETLVAGYYSGVVTAEELYDALTAHYENDFYNYSEALIKKNELNETFYDAVGLSSEEVINQFLDDYNVDLKNCKNYNQAKLEIEKQTIGQISGAWSKFYDAQSKTLKMSMRDIKFAAMHGDSDADKFLGKYDTVKNYEAAIKALNNIAYNGIKSNYESVGSKLNAKDSSKETKDTTETFNWIETAISRIQRVISNLGDTVSATWRNWTHRNSSLASELAEVRKEISLQQSAYEAYIKKAESIGLSENYKNLIQNGGLSIEDITDETLKEQINDYKEW